MERIGGIKPPFLLCYPIPVRSELSDWYQKNRRILPWREDPTPYHVWLSEIMLQQTRVEAVKGYYHRFLERFPDIASLASADEESVLKLWEGLGYYSRARNLHKAASEIVSRFGGEFPSSKEDLLSLPGIGEYSASAILSIAFQKKEVAVDGNLLRVYSRLEASSVPIQDPKAKKACHDYFLPHLGERPGDINQALMDLGELICLPNGSPHCEACPLQGICKAHAMHQETSFPVVGKKTEKTIIPLTVFLLRLDEKIILSKRPPKGLLASLYELPNVEGHLSIEEAKERLEGLGFQVESIQKSKDHKHVFTHRIWEMRAYSVRVLTIPKGYFVAELRELSSKFPLPSAFSRFLPDLVG